MPAKRSARQRRNFLLSEEESDMLDIIQARHGLANNTEALRYALQMTVAHDLQQTIENFLPSLFASLDAQQAGVLDALNTHATAAARAITGGESSVSPKDVIGIFARESVAASEHAQQETTEQTQEPEHSSEQETSEHVSVDTQTRR